ncbi:uncharacterized protein LOC105641288 isoform X2 [Jatropha curcas]|uniref:uncharacterized protein LOC105641288 isoform X2 n=1 Tax=Jatropha curcas TaxID=180498 RepID=UPI00189485F2|nr:uncharacterized protein LOC105641288 isoform X2 [Jatropha curcas]
MLFTFFLFGVVDDDANMIMEALAKVIIATKIKSVCNLGMWCISMQQFDASFLSNHFHSILRAVVHALDNPFGSLSTTFEAIQVVMKFSAQLAEKMREFSHIWCPPIYRRLLSIDKRERDISERCLLKISSVILPSPAALSKALVKDMKWKLLTGMKDLRNQGRKVETLQAWGWFIRLLGSHALRNRHLTNDMLKIPEQTFSDHNPQVQIASQVAWEGLVDALIHHPIVTHETDEAGENSRQVQASAFSKSIKLLMTPLISTISSKCDVSNHLSCLNTWCYLLHKLDLSINHPLVIEVVLDPVFEAVFRMGLDNNTVWLWSLCLDLLNDFIMSKCRKPDYESSSHVSHHSSVRASMPSISGKCLVKQHSVKWYPWGVNQLDFFIKMISIILSHASIVTNTLENRNAVCDDALRIFRSLLRGVQIEFKSSSINYANIVLCLNTILRFMKETCENINSCGSSKNKLQCISTAVQFLQAVIDELEPSILGSPLYEVALDIRYIENLQSINDTKYAKFLSVFPIAYMDMVSPLAYLITLCICMVIQLTSDTVETELVLQRFHNFFKLILFSYNPLGNLQVAVGLLYKHAGYRNLHMWIAQAQALKDCMCGIQDFSMFKMEADSNCYLGIYQLLSYPFVAWSSSLQTQASEKVSGSTDESYVSTQRKLDLEHVIEVWKSVYGALCASKCFATESLADNLCSMLNWCIDENIRTIGRGTELNLSCNDLKLDFLSLSGNAVACILEVVSAAISDVSKSNHAEPQIFGDLKSVLGFAARFLKHWAEVQSDSLNGLPLTSRVLSDLAHFMSCLHSKQTILSTIEIVNSSLLQLLSLGGLHDGSTKDQLQCLWAETLACLRRSKPPISFDSSFLKLQAPLLEKTLDHPNPVISELTINFWNSTYGETIKLNYPETLLDVLDKLSRNKRIILHKKSLSFLVKCSSTPELTAQRYKVSATHNRSTKRVEFVENTMNQMEHKDNLKSSFKRKRLELTEHQKEVRRAQQGRGMDCNGHGPGVRTYTTVDFSQGNEDSQESQEIRNPDSIMEMPRRVT